jgi:hypothetical protein
MNAKTKKALWMTIKDVFIHMSIFTILLAIGLALGWLVVITAPYSIAAIAAAITLFIACRKIVALYKQNLNQLK